FELSGFDFDVSALIDAVSGGEPTFSPLTVDLFLNSGLIGLLRDVTIGQPIPSIRIEGVFNDGFTGTQKTDYDLRLGNVELTRVHDANSSGDIGNDHDSLTFDYTKVSLTTRPV